MQTHSGIQIFSYLFYWSSHVGFMRNFFQLKPDKPEERSVLFCQRRQVILNKKLFSIIPTENGRNVVIASEGHHV